MDGPPWSFLFDLPPVQRAVRSANDMAWETAQYVLTNERKRHDAALRAAQEESAQRLAELDAVNRKLRQRLADQRAAQQEADQQRERERHQREVIDAELDRNTFSDLFCCPRCWSLWLLSSRPDDTTTVHGPIGVGCDTCRDRPLLRLAAAKAKMALTSDAADIPHPVAELPDIPLPLPGDRAKRGELGADFVADLVTDTPEEAIAKIAAERAVRLVRTETDGVAPADRCAGLSAIADGLDRVPKLAGDGIAWCATEIMGMPEFPVKVIGKVVSHIVLDPLHMHTIAQGVRAFGTVCCAADDQLGQCRCARHLVADAGEAVLEARFADVLDRITEPPTVPEIDLTPEVAEVDEPRHEIGWL